MAEIEDREQFALLLSLGISALREHPEFKTRRKKREALPSGRTFSESYIDRISVPLGISPNTIKSWMGQMGNRYIPSRIEDGKLFGLLWMIMEKGVMDARWFNDLLHATSIPVIEPPVPAWFASCFKKAKILREDGTYGPPSEESIPSVAESAFDGLSRQGADTTEKLAEDNRHNLPRRWLEIFVGREQDLQAINQWLWSSSSVCLITGWGGMGKSTLALETAYACISDSHGVARKFKWPVFSYVIWISAEPKQLTFSDFLDTIAYQLGRVELLEKSLIEKRLVVRNALAAAAIQLPVFLIIDSLDTAEAEIYEFVANMPQGIKVLMTARENPSTVHAHSIRDMDIITLVGLKDAEALEYLHKEVTHHWNLSNLPVKKQRLKDLLEEKTEVLLQLIAATAGNPKAISLSVAYMIDDDLSPKQLVGEIEKASYSLSTLFNYLFGRSWERCSEDAKRLWQTLGFFDKSPVEESWSKIAGLDARRFHAALEQLKSFALVETERSRDTIQYRAHQTVLSYGEKRLVENEKLERELCTGWADYYIDYLDRHLKRSQLDEPYWKFLIERDLKAVKFEWPNILKLLKWAGDREDPTLLIEIMLRISHYLSRFNFTIRIEYGLKAAQAARNRGDARLAALFYIDTVGWALIESGNHAEGLRQIEVGLKLIEELRDDRPEVQDLIVLGQVFKARYCLNTNQLSRAEHILGQLALPPQSPIIQHRLLLVRGELSSIQGNYAEAIDLYERANEISQSYGGETTIEAYFNLGVAYVKLGEYEKAETTFDYLLLDKKQVNLIEYIFYYYGRAQILAGKGQYHEAVDLTMKVLTKIDTWEQTTRIKAEVESFYHELRGKLRLNA